MPKKESIKTPNTSSELKLMDSLAQSKAELVNSFYRYAELYEFAPTGYLTLARDTTILEVNRTATMMFGVECLLLKGNRFITFLCADDRPVLEIMIEDVFRNREHQYCEVKLLQNYSGHTVRIDAALSKDGQECRAIIVDITERKQAADDDVSTLMLKRNLKGENITASQALSGFFDYLPDTTGITKSFVYLVFIYILNI